MLRVLTLLCYKTTYRILNISMKGLLGNLKMLSMTVCLKYLTRSCVILEIGLIIPIRN